jgi:outer membrane protein OmpA-like peptidoglycan-associated protein
MSDSITTATPETKNAAPTAHLPVRENQIETEVDRSQVAGQLVMRSIGGGSPAAQPERFAGALGQMSGGSQVGMIRQLQRSYGNSYAGRVIQAKLTVGQAGDVYEQEADRIADRVMQMPDRPSSNQELSFSSVHASTAQRKCTACEEEKLQRKENGSKTETSDTAPSSVHEVLNSPGQPLDPATRAFMEPRFGQDFSRVQVHSGAAAEQSARDLNANAYTVGHNIVFGSGRFAPETQEGRRLLAHELTHVVQQSAQGSARIDPQNIAARDTNSEHEAEQAAEGDSSNQPYPIHRRSPQGIVQRQMCTDILNAEEVPGVTRGVEVERLVRADLIAQLGVQNIVGSLTIPGASSRDYRMEDCGGFQRTQPPRSGFPDLAFRRYKGRTVELAEVKIGTWPCLDLAEIQVNRYVKLADENEDYKRQLGIDNFEVMPTSRFTPSQMQSHDGTPVNVGWCSPGVIVYKAVASGNKEEQKDKESKDKEPGPSDTIPEQLLKLGEFLAPELAAVALLDFALAIAGTMVAIGTLPLVALATLVLGIVYFWDKFKLLGSKIAGLAQWVWGKFTWILGKLQLLGIKLAELGNWLAGKIAWLAGKLAEGVKWAAGKVAAGAKWVGHKIASAAEAAWDWFFGSDPEPIVPFNDIPVTEETTEDTTHCATVAHEDTIVKIGADLLFPFNEWKLKPEADDPLKEAAAKIGSMLQKDDRIMIDGYTDNIGSDEYNQHLSEQRAGAVASWFVEHGVVPMSRIQIEGYGKTRAQYNNPEGRKKDRRVDIWVPKHGSVEKVCW